MGNGIRRLLKSMASLTPRRSPRPPASPPHDERLLKGILRDIDSMAEEKKFESGVFINDQEKRIVIQLSYHKDDQLSLRNALGELMMATDVVKQQFSAWRMKDVQRQSVLRVPGNGNGGLHGR